MVYIMEYYLAMKKEKPAIRNNIDIMPREISERDKYIWYHLYVESKIAELIQTEKRMMPGAGGWQKWEDVGQRVQNSSYKINKSWRSNIQHGDDT